jgi:hypothetical protein
MPWPVVFREFQYPNDKGMSGQFPFTSFSRSRAQFWANCLQNSDHLDSSINHLRGFSVI